ncbi:MAG: NAD-dependent epimerase/dehydratase family protein [Jatrophihabitans sp.]|uniref:NAD-dependent epimerase/dehydratase family protein n=1 Tax=Jatrophihabitans sp. TaxID=1932789 RepID=UPI003911B318
MRVFLAGATGAIGTRLVPQLVAAGHSVVATTRTQSKLGLLSDLGAEPVVVDGLDAAAVGEAVAAAEPDAVVHQMTALAGMSDLRRFDRTFAATNQLRRVGTDNLLAAARAAGVRRFVAQSFTGWPNERVGGPIKSESDPLDPSPPKAQRETLAAIEYLERAVPAAPLESVILRYGMFYGPGGWDDMLELVRRRRLPIVGDGSGIWSLVHLDDAAAATIAALDRGHGTYNVVDDEPAPVADVLTTVAEILSAKPPRRVPVWVGRLAAGEVGVSMMTRVRGSSNARAKRELGWAPRWASWRDGFRAGLDVPADTRRG